MSLAELYTGKRNKGGRNKKIEFLLNIFLIKALPPSPQNGTKLYYFSLFWGPKSIFFYKYFFRTCTQTGAAIQKNGFQTVLLFIINQKEMNIKS